MGFIRYFEEKLVRKDKRDELVEVIEVGLEVINNFDEDDEQEDEDGFFGEKLIFNENDFIEGNEKCVGLQLCQCDKMLLLYFGNISQLLFTILKYLCFYLFYFIINLKWFFRKSYKVIIIKQRIRIKEIE